MNRLFSPFVRIIQETKNKLRGFGPLANYANGVQNSNWGCTIEGEYQYTNSATFINNKGYFTHVH
jgi:hypothetical protein